MIYQIFHYVEVKTIQPLEISLINHHHNPLSAAIDHLDRS